MKAFFTSQFKYCPRTWMFHNRKLNIKINRLHEKCLRLIYSDRISSYEQLLNKDKSAPIHQNNLRKFNLPRNCDLNYNLHCHPEFASRAIDTVHYGSESLSFLVPKIWKMLPLDLKNSESLDSFKSGIKNWYIHQKRFTQTSK